MRAFPHENTTDDYARARALRHAASPVERVLWRVLSPSATARGIKFRRQQVIHPYVADFCCLSARVLVELDGFSHETRVEQDVRREAALKREGYDVLRFANEDVMNDVAGTVETILRFVENKLNEEEAK